MTVTPTDWRAPRTLVRLLLVGALGGLLSGTFGVGGGIIMVPLLVSLLAMDQRRAAATSLVAIMPSALTGAIAYALRGEVDVPVAAFVAVGSMTGALVGTALLRRLRVSVLRWLFLALTVAVGVRMLLVVPVRGETVELGVGSALGLVALGLFMGVASGLFGIGGGVIAVPALIALFGSGDLVAKGTSLLIMLPTTVVGTHANLRNGFVDVRSGLVVGLAAVPASLAGASLAFLLSPRLSTVLFLLLLAASAAQIAARGIAEARANRSPRGWH